jgi:integrase/recombinase XerD
MLSDEKLIQFFLDKIKVEDALSKNTVSSYQKDLLLFSKFINEQKKNITNCDKNDISNYLNFLHQQNLKATSINRKISALRNFFNFLGEINKIENNPLTNFKLLKTAKNLPKFLSEKEVFSLLDNVAKDNSEYGVKLSCMIELMYSSGLRVSELVNLKKSDIQVFEQNGEKTIKNNLIIKGKGDKERLIMLNKSSIKILLKYLDFRKKAGFEKSKWLFVGNLRSSKNDFQNSENNGENEGKKNNQQIKTRRFNEDSDKPITRQRFHQMLKDAATQAKIDASKVHPHIIRHSFATHLLNSGVDLRVLQEMLGHSDISTTEIYTHILSSKLRDLVLNHHPLNKMKI